VAAVLRASAFVLLAFVLPGLAPRRAWRLMDVGHRLLEPVETAGLGPEADPHAVEQQPHQVDVIVHVGQAGERAVELR